MNQIAAAAKAPQPMFVNNPVGLNTAVDWFTNAEPVLQDAQRIIDILNPTTVVTWVLLGRKWAGQQDQQNCLLAWLGRRAEKRTTSYTARSGQGYGRRGPNWGRNS